MDTFQDNKPWVLWLQQLGRIAMERQGRPQTYVVGLPCRNFGAVLIAAGAIEVREEVHRDAAFPLLVPNQLVMFVLNRDADMVHHGIVHEVLGDSVRVSEQNNIISFTGENRRLVQPDYANGVNRQALWTGGDLVTAICKGDARRARSFVLGTAVETAIVASKPNIDLELQEEIEQQPLKDLIRPEGSRFGSRSRIVPINGMGLPSNAGIRLVIYDGWRAWIRRQFYFPDIAEVIVLDRQTGDSYDLALEHFRDSYRYPLSTVSQDLPTPPRGIWASVFGVL